jgi:hypothetical protein
MERLTRGRAPGRGFDIEFWQALGPSRILEAARGILRSQPLQEKAFMKISSGYKELISVASLFPSFPAKI